MREFVGAFLVSAGLFAVGTFDTNKQKQRQKELLNGIVDLNKASQNSHYETSQPHIASVCPTKPTWLVALRTQRLVQKTTMQEAGVVRMDRLLSTDPEEQRKAFQVELFPKLTSTLAFTDKVKLLTDDSFGLGHARLCAAPGFQNKFGSKLKLVQRCTFDGTNMQKQLSDAYKITTTLDAANLYELKVRTVNNTRIYLWGKRHGEQFQYSQAALDPDQLIAQHTSHIPAMSQAIGFLGMCTSAGLGISSRM